MKLLVSAAVACRLAILFPAAMGQKRGRSPRSCTFKPSGRAGTPSSWPRIASSVTRPLSNSVAMLKSGCVLPPQTAT